MEVPLRTENVRITSSFGTRTFMLNGKIVTDNHRGIDLRTNPHDPNAIIRAFEDGTVVRVQRNGSQNGTLCFVRLRHNNGIHTLYAHQQSGTIPSSVVVGAKVRKGDHLGLMGTTGRSTGVHLHFQIDRGSDSSAVEPYPYLFGLELDEVFNLTRLLRHITPMQRGEDIKMLQQELNRRNITDENGKQLVVDGIFGPLTDSAVRNFQRLNGLIVDGIVGINTSRLLEWTFQGKR